MIFFRSLAFVLAIPLMTTIAVAQGRGGGGGGALKAEAHVVKSAPFVQSLSTVGTLRANESVVLVPEVSRRLVRIEIEEGSEVEKGDLLFKLDDSDLQAELAGIEAQLQLALINKERADNLLPKKAISRQEYDSSSAEFNLLQARKNVQEVEILKTSIRAPFSGRVGVRQVSEGAFVSPATPLITLQDVSRIKVDFPLPERYAAEVKTGQKFTFTVAGNGRVFEGLVTVLEPAIDSATRSLLVRGLCSSPDGLLPGGFAEVTLSLDTLRNGFVVPSQAIVPSPRGQGVYLIENGKAVMRTVEIGIRTDEQVQILRGVKEGDVVAVTNLLRMRPGVEVTASNLP